MATHSPDSFYFDYGDGFVDSQPGCHDYSSIGNYIISMNFCNSNGCTQAFDTVNITAIGPVDPGQYYYNWSGGLGPLFEVDFANIYNQSSSMLLKISHATFKPH
ncbi:MAG: PKD domain-containing protein [Bacteroidetes bacterium]|nr:PKD domain-containing protein [Bacteroidota bacterium]